MQRIWCRGLRESLTRTPLLAHELAHNLTSAHNAQHVSVILPPVIETTAQTAWLAIGLLHMVSATSRMRQKHPTNMCMSSSIAELHFMKLASFLHETLVDVD